MGTWKAQIAACNCKVFNLDRGANLFFPVSKVVSISATCTAPFGGSTHPHIEIISGLLLHAKAPKPGGKCKYWHVSASTLTSKCTNILVVPIMQCVLFQLIVPFPRQDSQSSFCNMFFFLIYSLLFPTSYFGVFLHHAEIQ